MVRGLTLAYGEAGTGKTVLAIELVNRVCRGRKCVYVTTEGIDFLKRAEQVGAPLESLVITEAYDLDDLVYIVNRIASGGGYALIVVDSVNAPFRGSVGDERAATKLMYVVSVLEALSVNEPVPVYLTGQVHAVEGVGIEAVGLTLISPWLASIARLERVGPSVRRLVFERHPELKGVECIFKITGRGVAWLSPSR